LGQFAVADKILFISEVCMTNHDSAALVQDTAPSQDNLRAELARIPWDFSERRRSNATEKLHPYPAKFIPDIPAALLDSLPLSQGSTILDPFCGSGTTLAEAQARGYNAIGVDLNPIACLISRVRTAPAPINALDEATVVVAQAKKMGFAPIPNIPNLDHWFAIPAQDAVARLVAAIRRAPKGAQDFLQLALSSVLVRVSNQDSDTRYAAVKKNITEELVYSAFSASAVRIAAALAEHSGGGDVRVIEHDTLTLSPDIFPRKVSAVITSPPYPNAYEYWLYHKYRMWWLGHDPLAIKDREIGARAHFFGGQRHDATSFVFQMKQLFNLLDKVLDENGYACFVVGRSKIHGKIVDNAAIIKAAGHAIGLRERFSVERVISATRKSFNLSHANIKTETVLVLSR
jgi:site-specific DNA-methyltransferase (cytosine-N4-specific)